MVQCAGKSLPDLATFILKAPRHVAALLGLALPVLAHGAFCRPHPPERQPPLLLQPPPEPDPPLPLHSSSFHHPSSFTFHPFSSFVPNHVFSPHPDPFSSLSPSHSLSGTSPGASQALSPTGWAISPPAFSSSHHSSCQASTGWAISHSLASHHVGSSFHASGSGSCAERHEGTTQCR